jgi:HEAT repeat protein
MINPFLPKDKEYLEFQEAEKIVKSNLSELRVVAQDLILDERYKKFFNLVKEGEENTIDLLLRYKENDPYKFKAVVDSYLIELKVYRNLLNTIKDLSNPKQVNQSNFVQKFKENISGLINRMK